MANVPSISSTDVRALMRPTAGSIQAGVDLGYLTSISENYHDVPDAMEIVSGTVLTLPPVVAHRGPAPHAPFEAQLSVKAPLAQQTEFQSAGPPPPPFGRQGPTVSPVAAGLLESSIQTVRTEAPLLTHGQRWWIERAERYVAEKRGVDEVWRKRTVRVIRNFSVPFPGPRGATEKSHFERLGFTPPTSARGVTRAMIEALRDTPALAPTSRQNWTSRLRGFLAFEGNPLAADGDLWRFGKPVPKKRPRLDREKARSILRTAQGRERLVIALGLFNGFRAIEISRLKVGDLSLDELPPVVWILGKGDRGGKPRRVSVSPLAYGEILPFLAGKRPSDPVYPGTYSTIDKAFRAAQRRAGYPATVGTHALRRSFGSLSHEAEVDIAEIQAVYGHASPSTTAEYIGVGEKQMAAGMDRMARFFEKEAR